MVNHIKLAGKFVLICVLFVGSLLGLWWGLDWLQFSLVPPFHQPGVENWYLYDLPPKWFVIPAGAVTLVVYALGSLYFPDRLFDNGEDPPEIP